MICDVCQGMLQGHKRKQWRGTFDLYFEHHPTRRRLTQSAKRKCCICRSLLSELLRIEEREQTVPSGLLNQVRKWVLGVLWCESIRGKQAHAADQTVFTSASLSGIYAANRLVMYRLDVKVEDSKNVGTFVLQRHDVKTADSGRTQPRGKSYPF